MPCRRGSPSAPGVLLTDAAACQAICGRENGEIIYASKNLMESVSAREAGCPRAGRASTLLTACARQVLRHAQVQSKAYARMPLLFSPSTPLELPANAAWRAPLDRQAGPSKRDDLPRSELKIRQRRFFLSPSPKKYLFVRECKGLPREGAQARPLKVFLTASPRQEFASGSRLQFANSLSKSYFLLSEAMVAVVPDAICEEDGKTKSTDGMADVGAELAQASRASRCRLSPRRRCSCFGRVTHTDPRLRKSFIHLGSG